MYCVSDVRRPLRMVEFSFAIWTALGRGILPAHFQQEKVYPRIWNLSTKDILRLTQNKHKHLLSSLLFLHILSIYWYYSIENWDFEINFEIHLSVVILFSVSCLLSSLFNDLEIKQILHSQNGNLCMFGHRYSSILSIFFCHCVLPGLKIKCYSVFCETSSIYE